MRALNDALIERKVEARYVTLLVMLWSPAIRQFVMANAGSNPPMICRNGEILKTTRGRRAAGPAGRARIRRGGVPGAPGATPSCSIPTASPIISTSRGPRLRPPPSVAGGAAHMRAAAGGHRGGDSGGSRPVQYHAVRRSDVVGDEGEMTAKRNAFWPQMHADARRLKPFSREAPVFLIGVHRRSSAANKVFVCSPATPPNPYWPPINADERRWEPHPGLAALVCLICVYLRASAANKAFVWSPATPPNPCWPPINADERRWEPRAGLAALVCLICVHLRASAANKAFVWSP